MPLPFYARREAVGLRVPVYLSTGAFSCLDLRLCVQLSYHISGYHAIPRHHLEGYIWKRFYPLFLQFLHLQTCLISFLML